MNVDNIKVPTTSGKKNVLGGLTAKKVAVPNRLLVYGAPGVGKSTFAAGAPSPIFIGSEDGTAELSVVRYPIDIQTGEDILSAIDVLIQEEHSYETVVIDTIDAAEPMVWASVIRYDKKAALIEEVGGGYGKGYANARDFWRVILKKLETLQAKRRMHVLLIGHSEIAKFNNPEGADYDVYSINMNQKSASVIKHWCHDVLYAKVEKFSTKSERSGKAKGATLGTRTLQCHDSAAAFAKNRHNLPESIPFSWQAFADAVEAGRNAPMPQPESEEYADPETLREEIQLAISELDSEVAAKTQSSLEKAGDDVNMLSQLSAWVVKQAEKKRNANA